jgi:hypothetical protein
MRQRWALKRWKPGISSEPSPGLSSLASSRDSNTSRSHMNALVVASFGTQCRPDVHRHFRGTQYRIERSYEQYGRLCRRSNSLKRANYYPRAMLVRLSRNG